MHLIRIALLFVMNYTSSGTAMGIAIYYAKEIMGNTGVFGTLTLASVLPVFAGLFLFPKLADRFGKWKCLMTGYLLEIIGLGFILLMPANLPLLVVSLAIKGFGSAIWGWGIAISNNFKGLRREKKTVNQILTLTHRDSI